MFQGIHGKCCKLHGFLRLDLEMEGFVLQEIQRLKLRARTLAHFPQLIRDVRCGIRMRAPEPAVVDVFN